MPDQDLLQRRYRVLGKRAPLFYDEPLHLVRGEDAAQFGPIHADLVPENCGWTASACA